MLVLAEKIEDLLAALGADEQGAVAEVEAFGAGAEDCGGGLYFRSADLFDLCYGRRWVARPQGGGFAALAIGEVDDVNAAANVDEAGDGAAGARAEVGGVGAEDEDAAVGTNEIAHGDFGPFLAAMISARRNSDMISTPWIVWSERWPTSR